MELISYMASPCKFALSRDDFANPVARRIRHSRAGGNPEIVVCEPVPDFRLLALSEMIEINRICEIVFESVEVRNESISKTRSL